MALEDELEAALTSANEFESITGEPAMVLVPPLLVARTAEVLRSLTRRNETLAREHARNADALDRVRVVTGNLAQRNAMVHSQDVSAAIEQAIAYNPLPSNPSETGL